MVPTIRTTVRHVMWDAAEAAGRVDPGWTVPTRVRRGAIVNEYHKRNVYQVVSSRK
jgi:hypothetical protein